MSNNKIIRAWKDPVFRNSLSNQERALLPENPAGIVELTDAQLEGAGARGLSVLCSLNCTFYSCPTFFCTISIKNF